MNLPAQTPQRIVILISGRGSNMQAIVRRCVEQRWPAQVVAVLADRPTAAGLVFALEHGIATAVVDYKVHGDRAAFDDALATAIDARRPDLVVLAGFMRILGAAFVQRFEGRVLNIHPSLLPKYPGLDTHQRALGAGDAEAGCTVHLVTSGVDEGPVLGQARIPVRPGDTAETLADRVKAEEHRLYPAALAKLVAG